MAQRLREKLHLHPTSSRDLVRQQLTEKLERFSSAAIRALHHALSTPSTELLLLLPRPFNGLFSRITWISQYHEDKSSLDLNEARDDGVLGWQWHQPDHTQTICTSLQTDNHTSTSSLNFYTPNALPDARQTASKH